ncbi:MAG: exodeoxyribonuclease VII small subunit [Anaerolineales bacterium]
MKAVSELSYEEALDELERIVQSLEEEPHSLDESLRLYERGQALVARCRRLLEEAELKVQQLSEGELRPFEGDKHGN